MKTLWYDRNTEKVINYLPEHARRVYKFLLWNNPKGEDVLVAAPYVNFEGGDLYHANLTILFKGHVPDRRPNGAGTCERAQVHTWISQGYNLETDPADRPKILEALNLTEALA